MIRTLAVDGWAVTFGTARRGLGGAPAAQALLAVMRCLSVCPSDTFVDCVKTNKHIFIFFTAGDHTILVFLDQTAWRFCGGGLTCHLQPAGTGVFVSAEAVNQAGKRAPCDPSVGHETTAEAGFLAGLTVTETRVGTSDCPWVVRAPAGRRVNLTLFNFAGAVTTGDEFSHRSGLGPGCPVGCWTRMSSRYRPRRLRRQQDDGHTAV